MSNHDVLAEDKLKSERQQIKEKLQPLFQQALEAATDVYHKARVGHLIDDSEEPWDQVLRKLAQTVQNQALQTRISQVVGSRRP